MMKLSYSSPTVPDKAFYWGARPDKLGYVRKWDGYPGKWVVRMTRLHKLRGKTIIGYKKARYRVRGLTKDCIVVLRIASNTRRVSPSDTKCRAACAKVVAIHPINTYSWSVDPTPSLSIARSIYNKHFVYQLGAKVRPDMNFDSSNATCASGIHFFLTLEEAIVYRP